MLVSFSQEWGKANSFGHYGGIAALAADGGPALFGPTWGPLAAGRPKAVVY